MDLDPAPETTRSPEDAELDTVMGELASNVDQAIRGTPTPERAPQVRVLVASSEYEATLASMPEILPDAPGQSSRYFAQRSIGVAHTCQQPKAPTILKKLRVSAPRNPLGKSLRQERFCPIHARQTSALALHLLAVRPALSPPR